MVRFAREQVAAEQGVLLGDGVLGQRVDDLDVVDVAATASRVPMVSGKW